MSEQQAIFAAGCFWKPEADFRQIEGVTETEVGYIGGRNENPTYQQVCSADTGHAEAVRVAFDPDTVSYDQLLDAFWDMHDPTQVNRQGPDVGDQYRSAIFYDGETQRAAAEQSQQRAQARHERPIATQIVPAPTFYPAEAYHQKYYAKHGRDAQASTVRA